MVKSCFNEEQYKHKDIFMVMYNRLPIRSVGAEQNYHLGSKVLKIYIESILMMLQILDSRRLYIS